MKIEFEGRKPKGREYCLGVRDDNNAEVVEFVLAAQQGDIDLSTFTAYVKSATPMYSFADKERVEIADGEEVGTIALRWSLKNKQTDNEKINVQLQFENLQSEIVWQTYEMEFFFHRTVKADKAVENKYPSVLQDFERRIEDLEEHGGGGGGVTLEELEQAIAEVEEKIPETAEDVGAVPKERTVNGKALTIDIVLDKADIGLGNVDNTSDENKPLSAAARLALGNKVDKTTTINGNPLSDNITLTAQSVGALADTTKYGASLDMTIDSSTYVVTVQLKDQDGNALGQAKTIDLPLESVVVNGSYNSLTKSVVLTLQNGTTITFSVADLVSGLQTEITSTNMLSADLVDDTNSTHKFVTAAEKTTWNAKQNALTFDTTPTQNSTNPVTSGGVYTAVNDRVPKRTSAYQLYGTDGSGNQTGFYYSMLADNYSFAQRQSNGTLAVADPTSPTHAVNLQYFESNIVPYIYYYSVYNEENGVLTVLLDPLPKRVYYVDCTDVSALSFLIGRWSSNRENEYKVILETGATVPNTVTFPSDLIWFDEEPTFEPNTRYTIFFSLTDFSVWVSKEIEVA